MTVGLAMNSLRKRTGDFNQNYSRGLRPRLFGLVMASRAVSLFRRECKKNLEITYHSIQVTRV